MQAGCYPAAALEPCSSPRGERSMRHFLLAASCLVLAAACSPSEPQSQVAKPDPAPAPPRLEERFPAEFGTCHYGVYLFGEKAGFLRVAGRREPATEEIHEEYRMEI